MVYMVSKKDSEEYLTDVMNVCNKVAHFRTQVKKALKEHQDYRVEKLTLGCQDMSVVLTRYELGICNSLYIEAKFDREHD